MEMSDYKVSRDSQERQVNLLADGLQRVRVVRAGGVVAARGTTLG